MADGVDRLRLHGDAGRLRAARRPRAHGLRARHRRLGDKPRREPRRRHHVFGDGSRGDGGDSHRSPGHRRLFKHKPPLARDGRGGHAPRDGLHFGPAAEFTARLAKVALKGLPPGRILNVNAPNLPRERLRGARVTRLGRRFYKDELVEVRDEEGRVGYDIYNNPPGHHEEEGTDFAAIENDEISVTPVHLELTDTSGHRGAGRLGRGRPPRERARLGVARRRPSSTSTARSSTRRR